MPVGDYFDQGRPTLNVGTPDKERWKKESLTFAYLPSLLMASSSILLMPLLLMNSFSDIRTQLL